MQLFQIANELGAETKDVMNLIGAKNHMVKLSDEEIDKIQKAFVKGKVKGDENPKDSRIRFISEKRCHTIPYEGGSVVFDDNLYMCERGSLEEGLIRSVMRERSEIHEVIDKPFKDEEQRAWFSSYLRGIALGEDNVPTQRGLVFLRAHFATHETADLKASRYNVMVLILRLVERKSYLDRSK